MINYSPWGVYQTILPGAHIPLAGLKPPILTAAPPWYFPLAFLEGHCPSLSLAVTSLYLDPTTWDPSAPSNKVASFSSTLSQSHWRYSIVFFFLSSSSTTLFLGFGLHFSPSFLSRTLCTTGLHYLLQLKEGLLLLLMLSLHLTALLLKHFSIVLGNVRVGRRRHGNTEIRAKNFSFHLCIVDLSTIMGFLAKLNRTSKAQS